MKTHSITSSLAVIAVAAVLFAGCGKGGDGRLRIYAGNMNSGSKVWVNPSSTASASSSASWVRGEYINLNGSPYQIDVDDDSYYLNVGDASLPTDLYAIYPATVTTGGNDITVTNNGASAGTVTIRSLAVNFRDNNSVAGHDIVFPMAASARAGEGKLMFDHLTGALHLTLTDTSRARDYTVGSVKVVVYGDGAVPSPLTARNVTTSWEVQGPVLPNGEIGHIDGNQPMGYASEMHFSLLTGGEPGKAIPHGVRTEPASISFVVPVTVTPVKKLVVTGYGTDGSQLFVRIKELTTALTIQANSMYTIPEILF